MTRIVSWNVNGLRALVRNGYFEDFLTLPGDIICLQETKASPEQLEQAVSSPSGFHTYFHSSTTRKGYSGTAVYSKILPQNVEYGLGIEEFDGQGRTLIVHYKEFILVNAYVPNGKSETAPLPFKLRFYDALLDKLQTLEKTGKAVIVCGDLNVAHETIDIARPDANKNTIGFLPEERAWIDSLIQCGYSDTFRSLNPDKRDVYSYWDQQSRARERNVGWRIDYFFVSAQGSHQVKNASIHTDIMGSDHCPVSLEIHLNA